MNTHPYCGDMNIPRQLLTTILGANDSVLEFLEDTVTNLVDSLKLIKCNAAYLVDIFQRRHFCDQRRVEKPPIGRVFLLVSI